jgi:O-antigen/teichoic acid export membrane protein
MSSAESEVKRGTIVNFLGMLGQLAGPAMLVVAARLYGPASLGIFAEAFALMEISIAFLTAGFRDAALMFVARHADETDEKKNLYDSLANAMLWSLGCSLLIIAATYLIGPQAFTKLFEFGDEIVPMMKAMVLVAPLFAVSRIVLAATQGLKIMKYEAIDGTLRSVTMFVLAVALWPLTRSIDGLTFAYVGSQAISFVFAVYVYRRRFELMPLLSSLRNFRLNRRLLGFAIPQNLNMALNHFITQVDVLMLGAMKTGPVAVGLYFVAARVVRELRRIRTIFSTSISPHIVVLYQRGALDELSRLYSKTAGWVALLAIPALLLLLALHPDVLSIFHADYARADLSFMLWLLLLPYFDCGFNLAGNVVAMTGHSRINLLNSLVVGATNVALNLFLIPRYGLNGAAVASVAASFLLAFLQWVEATYYLKVRLIWRLMLRPHLAGWASVGLLWFTKSVGAFGEGDLAQRKAQASLSVAAYLLIFRLLGGKLRPPHSPTEPGKSGGATE